MRTVGKGCLVLPMSCMMICYLLFALESQADNVSRRYSCTIAA